MSLKTLYVGVDISEEKPDVLFMDQDERALVSLYRYPNLPEGFRCLKQDILVFSRLLGKSVPIVVGFESTRNYHKNLETFLKRRRSKRFTVRILNPYQVKQFRKAHFTLSSTDRLRKSPGEGIPPFFFSLKRRIPFFSRRGKVGSRKDY